MMGFRPMLEPAVDPGVWTLMTLLLLVLHILAAPDVELGAIAGRILDAETGQPLAGVVVLLSELDRGALSDSLGRYRLDQVPAGPRHLSVRLLGYAPRRVHALVPGQAVLEINITLT